MENIEIELNTRKIVKRGEKFREILGFKGIFSKNELPVKYIQDGICIYRDDQAFGFSNIAEISENINIESSWYGPNNKNIIPEKEFQEMSKCIKAAHDRLIKVNEKIKIELGDWKGEETVIYQKDSITRIQS